ncbi:hypothetical protein PAV_2c05310 [Paenibacillus alvei DSM 29]|nr:hypothetical protein PAV_2c05310 [Paenibacillus alvei DSM 29]
MSDFDKVQGLVIGANDCMTKPFKQNSNLEFGGLTISPEQRTVTIYGKNIESTPKEFEIL